MKELKMGKALFKLVAIFIGLNTLLNATAPTQENVTKLYVATFNRAPDAAGLNYWVASSGLSLESIAESFFDQPETQETYPPGSTNTTFINAIYSNLFNRIPDTAGLNYWQAELDSGRIAKSVFILAVVNGAQGSDAEILTNKTTVGLLYVNAGLNDTNIASAVMADITADPTTVDSALNSYGIPLTSFTSSDYSSIPEDNTCRFANDGECDDGGPGAAYAECFLGTDTNDCGSRSTLDFTSASIPEDNTCRFPNDGACDDGGPGAAYAVCFLGTDTADCGSRSTSDSTSTDSTSGLTQGNYQVFDYVKVESKYNVSLIHDGMSPTSIGPDGKIYMYTVYGSGTGKFHILQCYNSSGTLLWETELLSNHPYADFPHIIFDESGYLYANYTGQTFKISSNSGSIIWNKYLKASFGFVYSNGYLYAHEGANIIKYDTDGNFIADAGIQRNNQTSYNLVYHNGIFYNFYYSIDSTRQEHFRKISLEQGVISDVAIPTGNPYGEAKFSNGHIYYLTNGFTIHKYSTEGILVSSFPIISSKWTVDGTGSIYSVGVMYPNSGISLVKYNSNGVQEWQTNYTYDDVSPYVKILGINSNEYDNNIHVTGLTSEMNPYFLKFKSSNTPETTTGIIIGEKVPSDSTGSTSGGGTCGVTSSSFADYQYESTCEVACLYLSAGASEAVSSYCSILDGYGNLGGPGSEGCSACN